MPALTDAGKAIPDISFDWVVEENFAEITRWHPLVKNTIPVSLRNWRKNILARKHAKNGAFHKRLRASEYDLVIDAQEVIKSAFLALNARGKSCGFSLASHAILWHHFYKKEFQLQK